MKSHNVAMLGTGLIGDFYTMTLHGQRNPDDLGLAVPNLSELRGISIQVGRRDHVPGGRIASTLTNR